MPVEPFLVDQHITAHSRYFAGKTGSRFFTTLRDQKKILGVRCNACNQVLWPPRSTCFKCFSPLSHSDLVEIGPHGTLLTFTRVHYREAVHPRKAPFIYGIIQLDGADTGMAHLLEGADFEALAPGIRVTAVFAKKRNGNILDIACFRVLP